MAIQARVWTAGKFLLLAGALAVTFFAFAGMALRVAVRARQVTVPDLVGTLARRRTICRRRA